MNPDLKAHNTPNAAGLAFVLDFRLQDAQHGPVQRRASEGQEIDDGPPIPRDSPGLVWFGTPAEDDDVDTDEEDGEHVVDVLVNQEFGLPVGSHARVQAVESQGYEDCSSRLALFEPSSRSMRTWRRGRTSNHQVTVSE